MFTVYLKKQSIVLHIKIKLLDARMKGKHGFEIHVVCTCCVIGLPSHLLYMYVDLEEKTLKHTP